MTGAGFHRGRVVAWDLSRERGEIESADDNRRLPVSGIYFNGFSATPHAGQAVLYALESHAGQLRIVAVRPAVGGCDPSTVE